MIGMIKGDKKKTKHIINL